MIISTNKQILSIFNQGENIPNSVSYLSKNTYKQVIVNGKKQRVKGYKIQVENKKALTHFDKLVFFACLTHINQNGGGIITLSGIYRIITGRTYGKITIRKEKLQEIKESIERLSLVQITPIYVLNNTQETQAKPCFLLDYTITEKGGYVFKKGGYVYSVTERLHTARTITPNQITPHKNKSTKMLLIEYDLIARLFYLKKSTQSIKQNIVHYCDKYSISQTHKDRIKTFLEKMLKHLQYIGFIKYFRFDRDIITIS